MVFSILNILSLMFRKKINDEIDFINEQERIL